MSKITSVDQLRSIIPPAPDALHEKVIDYLDEFATDFIASCPFLILSTASSDGRIDASPKGDAPGFVQVVNNKTLLLPDRPGNRLAYGHENILSNPHIGLLFILPNTNETLRINGTAELIDDEDVLTQLSARNKPATLAIRVTVEECFFHCAKAFIRSNLWQAEAWPERRKISFGAMFAARMNAGQELVDAIDNQVEEDYKNNL